MVFFDSIRKIVLADGETSQVLATDVESNTELTLNDLNEVVYLRKNFSLPPQRMELVITDGTSEKVIAKSGDIFDGLVVSDLTLGPQSLNNSRQVAFVVTYVLEPGVVKHACYLAQPACPEDLDGSGAVDAFDLAVLLGNWGPCPEPCPAGDPADTCPADLDGDCAVQALDLALLLGAWGPCL